MNPHHRRTTVPTRSLYLIARLACILLLATGGSALVAPRPTYAAGITVTTTTDELNNDGDCSLREAIQAANTNAAVDACTAGSGADVITLPAGTYTLTLVGADEDANAAGDLDIAGALTINGAGAATTIIDGNQAGRVLHIISGAVVFNDITVQNGRTADGAPGSECRDFCDDSSNGGAGASGGGIYNEATLTLNRVTVTGNTTGKGGQAGNISSCAPSSTCLTQGGKGGDGGGIFNSGTLSINASTITNNRTGDGGDPGFALCPVEICDSTPGFEGDGGGVSGGNLTVSDTTLSDNSAYNGGAIYQGGTLTIAMSRLIGNTATNSGGALNCNRAEACTISRSTLSGNDAEGDFGGGAIIFFGLATITNSTISGNTSYSDGAGIQAYSGPVTMRFVTIVNNTTDSDGGGIARVGAELTISNSIIANNSDLGDEAPDCAGELSSQGHNIVKSVTGCTLTASTGDITGVDPKLGSLADNGGSAQTHALLSGSPAIDAADDAACAAAPVSSLDQRGVKRPQGKHCDIGAFEVDHTIYLPLVRR